MSDYLKVENRAGPRIQHGETGLVLIEKSVSLQPPGMWGFFFWRRPAAVVVEHPEAGREVLEIPDVTRQAQLSILGLSLLITALAWLIIQLRNRSA